MKLRTVVLSLVAAVCLFLTVSASADVVLYDNGPDVGVNAFNISTFAVADSFTLSSNSTLTSVIFINWFFPGDSPVAVDWAIQSSPLGTNLFSGTATISSTFLGTNGLGADVYKDTIALPSIPLAPGTWYLQLTNETTGLGGPGFWAESDGPSLAFQSNVGQIPSESFQILGNTGTTPEPGTLALFGTGIVGLAGMLRRKVNL
jgi:hypothetical protein